VFSHEPEAISEDGFGAWKVVVNDGLGVVDLQEFAHALFTN